MKEEMNKIAECNSCGILSYVGRIKQNSEKCPFCDGDDIEYFYRDNLFPPEKVYSCKHAEAPLSIKLTIKESIDIHRKLFKEKQLQKKEKDGKIKKKNEIKKLEEDMKKVEFKDSQLEKYLKLQEKKLKEMIGEKNNGNRNDIS